MFDAPPEELTIAAPAYQLRPNPTFTVSDLVDIGEVAKSSMDIVGLPQEYVQGYAKLVDAISHLLGLVERDTEATRA